MFIDRIKITVQAGNGGNGCDSCYRRTDRKVVPHGGDGGNGGSVIFRADKNAPLLKDLKFKRHFNAENGGHGGSDHKRGKNGKDLLVLLPCGTRVYDSERNLLIREFNQEGEEVVIARGGKGGSGNQGGKPAVVGERGIYLEVGIELQLQADVFLVGLPNSGKSKLMNFLTRSNAKEENYPFTTKEPELGVVQYSDYEQITLCELPSIYASSHEGRGLGTQCLKHLKGAKLIAFCLSPVSEFADTVSDGLRILKKQVENYDPEFFKIPFIVIVNKMDLEESKAKMKRARFKPACNVFYVSAATGEGTKELIAYLAKEFSLSL